MAKCPENKWFESPEEAAKLYSYLLGKKFEVTDDSITIEAPSELDKAKLRAVQFERLAEDIYQELVQARNRLSKLERQINSAKRALE